jgi:hypothetical protein
VPRGVNGAEDGEWRLVVGLHYILDSEEKKIAGKGIFRLYFDLNII